MHTSLQPLYTFAFVFPELSHWLLCSLPFMLSFPSESSIITLFPHAPAPRDLPLVRSWILRQGLGSLVLGLGFCPFALTSYHLKSPSLPDCSFQTSQSHFSLVPVDYLGGLLITRLSFVSSYVNADDTHKCRCLQLVLTLCNWFRDALFPTFVHSISGLCCYYLSWPVWF